MLRLTFMWQHVNATCCRTARARPRKPFWFMLG
jgi:hypothetical protein